MRSGISRYSLPIRFRHTVNVRSVRGRFAVEVSMPRSVMRDVVVEHELRVLVGIEVEDGETGRLLIEPAAIGVGVETEEVGDEQPDGRLV